MAKKRERSENADRGPQSLDELLAFDNEPGRGEIPKELQEMQRERITISTLNGEKADIAKCLKPGRNGQWELLLPENAGVGIPGRSAERLPTEEIEQGSRRSKASLEPFRPDWLPFTPHPRFASPRRDLMRRIDGRPIEPHYGVFGTDDRIVYYPAGYPWTCVGKVNVWNNWPNGGIAWTGSAVLVGSRHLLTAGHVCPWGACNWAMQFVPAMFDGVSTAGRGVMSYVSDYRGYDTGNRVSAWDMAVCRLYEPLGNQLGWFGSKTYNSAWEGPGYWTLAGYPAAIASGNRPSRQAGISTIDDDTDGRATEVEHLGDSSGGNSGGPFFGYWSGLPYVIGAQSGGQKSWVLWVTIEDNNVAAGGAAMVDLIKWGHANWP